MSEVDLSNLRVPDVAAPTDQVEAHTLALHALDLFEWCVAGMGGNSLAPSLRPLLRDMRASRGETNEWLERVAGRQAAEHKSKREVAVKARAAARREAIEAENAEQERVAAEKEAAEKEAAAKKATANAAKEKAEADKAKADAEAAAKAAAGTQE